jgi:DNA-binding PadR family transcriptional regulator
MFHKFAFQGHGGDWEGWTPPWEQREMGWRHGPRFWRHGPHFWGHGPHHFGMRLRRGLFGHGPFGPGAPFGPGGPLHEARRFFGRGDVKYALLDLLQERPMHGYEMMKALEEKSGGFYTPSAGTIYPTLQMLEDRGLVTAELVDGKKVYSITESGRQVLEERQKDEENFENPFERWQGRRGGRQWAPELHALRSEAGEVARLFAIAGRMSFSDPEKLARLRAIIAQSRQDLSDLIYGTGPQQGQSAPGPQQPQSGTEQAD